MPSVPALTDLVVTADRAPWESFGLQFDGDGRSDVAGITFHLRPPTGERRGLTGWRWSGLGAALPITSIEHDIALGVAACRTSVDCPLGVVAVDHVVAVTGSVDRARQDLGDAGIIPRAERQRGDSRQAFFVVGATLLEVVGPAVPTEATMRLWGVTFAVADLDTQSKRLGHSLGSIRDAVQPGRRIAPLLPGAGLGTEVALITPRVSTSMRS